MKNMMHIRKASIEDSTNLALCLDMAARGLSAWGWGNLLKRGNHLLNLVERGLGPIKALIYILKTGS